MCFITNSVCGFNPFSLTLVGDGNLVITLGVRNVKTIRIALNYNRVRKKKVPTSVMAVCSEIHTKHINTLCAQKVEF